MSKKQQASSSPSHPPVGTLIDKNTLKLVEILGIGGYGVVYRAIDAYSSHPRSYAVKCLAHGHSRRQLHIREVTLHQIASAHPSVVTLHRIVEDVHYTFIIMDFAPDHDLFTQILHKCRYLGNNAAIKHVFLQIIDAVQYCHSLGIYHRDLKPENVLCFDQGYRVAITDFGLATTDKTSREFRTGSIYHMSPECQAADSVSGAAYSPMHNDIWSLGIILLNLTTGRNPWKSATPDDPTYLAYRRNPRRFLLSVLPISEELNAILVRTLAVDRKARLTLSELHEAVAAVSTFYSDSVVFDGNLATCPWEGGLDLGNGAKNDTRPLPKIPDSVEEYCVASMSAASNFRSQPSVAEDMEEEEEDVAWDGQHSEYELREDEEDYTGPIQSSYEYSAGRSSYSSDPASPITPVSDYGEGGRACSFVDWDEYGIYDRQEDSGRYREPQSTILSPVQESSVDDTDDNRFASSVFLATPITESKPFPRSPEQVYAEGYRTAKRYSSPNTSIYSVAEASTFEYDDGEIIQSSRDPRLQSREPTSPESMVFVTWPPETHTRAGSRPVEIPRSKPKSYIFNPLRFFPRSAGSSWLNPKTPPQAKTSPVRIHQVESRPLPPTQYGHHPQMPPRPKSNVANSQPRRFQYV